jgi:hypothetical protein
MRMGRSKLLVSRNRFSEHVRRPSAIWSPCMYTKLVWTTSHWSTWDGIDRRYCADESLSRQAHRAAWYQYPVATKWSISSNLTSSKHASTDCANIRFAIFNVLDLKSLDSGFIPFHIQHCTPQTRGIRRTVPRRCVRTVPFNHSIRIDPMAYDAQYDRVYNS